MKRIIKNARRQVYLQGLLNININSNINTRRPRPPHNSVHITCEGDLGRAGAGEAGAAKV